MKFPEGYLWEYPGFPSIFVSYLKTNDFFFSGHVGLPILQICELYKLNRHIMLYFNLFTIFLEFFTMIALRGHYTIDLIAGILMAHYCFMITEKYIHKIDSFAKININIESQRDMNKGIVDIYNLA